MMIISLLYLISAILSLSLGLFTFFNNPKGKIQKIFLILSIDIFLWAFDYCLMNLSIDVKQVTFLHRIGSIFYSLFYAIILHFIILITKNERLLSNKRLLKIFFLYLPAIISLVLYLFISPVKVSEHFKFCFYFFYWNNNRYYYTHNWQVPPSSNGYNLFYYPIICFL